MINPAPYNYFNRMRHYDPIPKGSQIECPAVRYLYYVIANTLQARGEFTRVNEEDMMILAKDFILDCNLTLNLGALLVFYLAYQSHQTRGPICCGGVITILTRAHHINIGNLQPMVGVRHLGFATLNACGMVRRRQGRYFLDIPGADHLITAPLSHGLFSIEDGVCIMMRMLKQIYPNKRYPKKMMK